MYVVSFALQETFNIIMTCKFYVNMINVLLFCMFSVDNSCIFQSYF